MKRFLAYVTESLLGVVISTRKASMPSGYKLPDLFEALRYGNGSWSRHAFEAMITYLGKMQNGLILSVMLEPATLGLGLNRCSNSLITKSLRTLSNPQLLKSVRMSDIHVSHTLFILITLERI